MLLIHLLEGLRNKSCLLIFVLILKLQSIRVPGNFTWESSQKPENKAKNRYKNIIPCKLKTKTTTTTTTTTNTRLHSPGHPPTTILWDQHIFFVKNRLDKYNFCCFPNVGLKNVIIVAYRNRIIMNWYTKFA